MYPNDKEIMYSEYFDNCGDHEEKKESFVTKEEREEIRNNTQSRLYNMTTEDLCKRLSKANKEDELEEGFINTQGALEKFIKYFIEGIAVAVVGFVLVFSKKGKFSFNRQGKEILIMGLTAGLVFGILDMYAPSISVSTRQGAGFGLGANLVGFPILR
tara:strand:+ start:201 stop:674 length:474 start_codon:yes stop_codon:yes gene_type:complete